MAVLPEIGGRIAGYRIVRLIGRGGMGVVYEAEQLRLRRRVALKVIAPELADDRGFRERFERESQTAASLDHPNIVPVYEADEADGMLFISMRYIDGVDLGNLLARSGPLTPEHAASVAGQIGGALDAAHAVGLIHRDVKPGNILVQGDWAYLTDFGLTKRASSRSGLTQTGQWVGTIDYVAPEQIAGAALDGRVDVYALGCVLYEMLTANVPYERDSDAAKLYAQLYEPPPTVTAVRYGIPPGFDAVIANAMAKSPELRYQTAGDVGLAASAALRGDVPATAVATGPSQPAPPAAAETLLAPPEAQLPPPSPYAPPPTPATPVLSPYGVGPPPSPPPSPPPPNRRSPMPWIAAVIACLILIGGGVAAAIIVTSGNKSSSTNAANTTDTTTVTTGTTDTTTDTTTTGADAGTAALDSVNSYWSAINNQDWHDAYSHLVPGTDTDEATWTSDEESQGITSASFTGQVSNVDSNGVTIDVQSLNTQDSQNGCRNWSGTYHVVDQGGSWLIDVASISPTPC